MEDRPSAARSAVAPLTGGRRADDDDLFSLDAGWAGELGGLTGAVPDGLGVGAAGLAAAGTALEFGFAAGAAGLTPACGGFMAGG